MEKFFEWMFTVVAGAILAITLGIGISAVVAFPVKWAWNATMPDIFHIPEIGAVKAFCLVFLAATFFKSTASASVKRK